MRIAIYHNLHSGGAKRVLDTQLAYLAPCHQVTVYSLKGAAVPKVTSVDYRLHTLPYRPLPMARRPFGRLNPLVRMIDLLRLEHVSRSIAAEIDREKFDVVLVHPCQITQAPLIMQWLRTPAVYVCQELPRQYYEPMPSRPYYERGGLARAMDTLDPFPKGHLAAMRIVDRQSALQASVVAANSRYSQQNIEAAYGRQVHICYPGVDSRAFAPAGCRRERVVLSVGALTPLKGFDFIVEALATLPVDERPRLLVISNYQEGQEREYLEALAATKQVQLELRASVSDAELQAAYSVAGCVAYAPLREPFGLVALEAMAAGAPLVAVAEGGVAETVIDGETGLVAAREPVAFGRALQQMLASQQRAEQLAAAARRHVQSYWTLERHVNDLEHLLALAAGMRR